MPRPIRLKQPSLASIPQKGSEPLDDGAARFLQLRKQGAGPVASAALAQIFETLGDGRDRCAAEDAQVSLDGVGRAAQALGVGLGDRPLELLQEAR